jgi:long-subunit fatty acid transport protein
MRRLSVALILAASLSATAVHASAPEVIGLGSEESALAGASAARVHDFSAGFYDPAGLTLLRRPEVSIGVVGFLSSLKLAGPRTMPISDPLGIVVGAATPVPLKSWLEGRVFVGVGLYLSTSTTVRIIAHRPDEPFYPLYDNRTQRLVVLPTLAVKLPRGVSLGIAFNYLAGLSGNIEATEGATRAIEARVDEQIVSVLSVNAGIRWQATREFAAALVYRQAFGIPFSTVTNNHVAGQPIDLDVSAEGLYTPHELVLGTTLRLPFRVVGSLDLEWDHWSAYPGPYVTVSSQLPYVGQIDAQPPHVAFNDTVAVRGGLEWTVVEKKYSSLVLRGGYAFMSKATPDQPGVTNLLDGHKHRLCLGGGLRFELFGAHIRSDIHGSLEIVQPDTLTKEIAPAGTHPDPAKALVDEVPDDPAKPSTLGTQISNPGYPSITSGGWVWALGLTITVEWK